MIKKKSESLRLNLLGSISAGSAHRSCILRGSLNCTLCWKSKLVICKSHPDDTGFENMKGDQLKLGTVRGQGRSWVKPQ